jgi:hypothetical protein
MSTPYDISYRNLGEGKVDAGRVAARPSEADDETESDRTVGDAEHDRNVRSRRFRRQGRSGSSDRDNTATSRRTNSAAIAGNRSYWPSWRSREVPGP